MRSYTAQQYTDLVENIEDEVLQRFMRDEKKFISGVKDAKSRTFVDLGAGNGRVEPFLSSIARDVIAIEINPDMYAGLIERVAAYGNVSAKRADFLELQEVLTEKVNKPVFLFLQNTLGTIERGTAGQALDAAITEAKAADGEVILSIFRQPALKAWGTKMYKKISNMLGRLDPNKTVFEKGVFVTDTDYTSKWWTDEDINNFRMLGNVVRESSTDEYAFLELSFK